MEVISILLLVEPSVEYKESFIKFLHENEDVGDISSEKVDQIINDFNKYVDNLLKRKNNDKKMLQTVYWLVEDKEFIGQIAIKHGSLNEEVKKYIGHFSYIVRPSKRCQGYGKIMLKKGLKKAKKMGFKKVMIACNIDNIGSKKIIEYNGGKLKDIVNWEKNPKPIARYWIDLIKT